MPTTQTVLFPPPQRDINLPSGLLKWLFSLQMLHPLRLGDSSAGNYSEALPPAGVNSTTGQSAQNQEIIYIKTSADANTWTITGAVTGDVILSTQYEVARFKSNGTHWYFSCCESGGGGGSSFDFGTFLRSHGWSFGADQSGTQILNPFGCEPGGGNGVIGAFPQVDSIAPASTEPAYLQYKATSGATTVGGASDNQGSQDGSDGAYAITLGTLNQALYRVLLPASPVQQRIWIGIGDSAAFAASIQAMRSDTPNCNFVGFRYAPATAGDTHWQAYCGTSSAAHTLVDTGVTPDNAGHVFKIVSASNGASIQFFIDGTLVATISTNIPSDATAMCNLVSNDNAHDHSVVTAVNVSYMGWQSNV